LVNDGYAPAQALTMLAHAIAVPPPHEADDRRGLDHLVIVQHDAGGERLAVVPAFDLGQDFDHVFTLFAGTDCHQFTFFGHGSFTERGSSGRPAVVMAASSLHFLQRMMYSPQRGAGYGSKTSQLGLPREMSKS
jgi:hypothetical protein